MRDIAPPQNLQAEQSVLGASLIDREALERALDMLTPRMFYRDAHQAVFSAMRDLYESGRAVDLITLSDELRRRECLDVVGGASYIAGLADIVPTTANVEHYARIVRGDALLRGHILACNKGLDLCYDRNRDPEEIAGQIEQMVFTVNEHRGFDPEPMGDTVDRVMKRLAAGLVGEAFPIASLTRYTGGGMRRGEYTLVLAYRGTGKTRFLLSLARERVKRGIPVLLFSLEMSKDQLTMALIAMELGVPLDTLCNDPFGIDDADQAAAAARVASWPLLIDDRPRLTVDQMLATARRAKRRHRIELVGIDYAQKIRSDGRNIYEQGAAAAAEVKDMAKTLDLPVVLLGQLTKEGKVRADGIPEAHARGAMEWENEAETVLVLNRPSLQYDPEDEKEYPKWLTWQGKAQAWVTKNRHGVEQGGVRIIGWQENIGAFYDLEETGQQ